MKVWKTEFICRNGNKEEAVTLFPEGESKMKDGFTFKDVRQCVSTHYYSDGTCETRITRLGNVAWQEIEV